MLTIAINTASQESALALIQDDRVLGEVAWISNANESTKVLPGLEELLKNTGKTWEDLTRIFVIKGPGAYTSLRVGITIANGLAWTLKIPMLSSDVFELWKHRLSPADRQAPHLIAIAAGRDFYQIKDDPARHTLEQLFELQLPLYGEIPKAQTPAHTFAQAVIELIPDAEESEQVEPIYARPPDITIKKD